MARDYKHARRSPGGGLSVWGGMLIGLALGLAVAAAVYVHDRRPGVLGAGSAPLATEHDANDKASPAPQSADAETQYDFYDVLPNFEVVVPEAGNDAKGAGGAIDTPGSYVLQAGSYRNFADADRVRAQLALLGIESRIQKASVGQDNDVWHRVIIGPIANLSKLEETRRKLREAQIDVMVTKNARAP